MTTNYLHAATNLCKKQLWKLLQVFKVKIHKTLYNNNTRNCKFLPLPLTWSPLVLKNLTSNVRHFSSHALPFSERLLFKNSVNSLSEMPNITSIPHFNHITGNCVLYRIPFMRLYDLFYHLYLQAFKFKQGKLSIQEKFLCYDNYPTYMDITILCRFVFFLQFIALQNCI